jgi:hypothetical protein
MSKSVKAALLSAFVFPGLGHFYLQQRISGTVLAGAAIASLFFVISKSLESALQIAEQIQTAGGPRDIAEMSRLLAEQTAGSEWQLFNMASAVFVGSWLVGIFDSYRTGRAMSKNDPENS